MNPAGEGLMPTCIRRSLLELSIDDPQLQATAFNAGADAIILEPSRRVGVDWQRDLKARMPAVIQAAARGGAEVFVRVGAGCAAAELAACVFTGIAGVVLTGVGSADAVRAAAEHLDALEARRGIPAGTLEIDVEVDNAAVVWDAVDIARASERFGLYIVNEAALRADLGMALTTELEFDPLEYVKSQLITVAMAAGGQAVGMSYPLGLTREEVSDETLRAAVRRARDTGFKGALCRSVASVGVCNEGFRPSAEEAAYYVKVIEVFAEGISRGMASVPLDGKMLDVPVDVRARLYLQWDARARARDAQKATARAAASA